LSFSINLERGRNGKGQKREEAEAERSRNRKALRKEAGIILFKTGKRHKGNG
jgi:hypothetical protein